MDSYGHEIADILASLADEGLMAVVNGDDLARFVFAVQSDRAIELSRSESGWWLECWMGDEVVAEKTFDSRADAVQHSKDWLVSDRQSH